MKKCPSCGTRKIKRRIEETTFGYGADENSVEIPVRLPVYRCNACDIDFTDGVGEKLRHEAVCRHLGVMTPGEIPRYSQGSCTGRFEVNHRGFHDF